MTDAEIAAMRARENDAIILPPGVADASLNHMMLAWQDRADLLAEVEAWREIGRALAGADMAADEHDYLCQMEYVGPPIDGFRHIGSCRIEQARALLAGKAAKS